MPGDTRYGRLLVTLRPTDNLDILLSASYQHQDFRYGPNQDIGLPRYQGKRFYPADNRWTTRIYNATINYMLPFATLTSVTSYIDKSNFSNRDLTNQYVAAFRTATGSTVPNLGISINNVYPNRAFTQEARITSTSTGPFHWLAGIYYNNFHPHNFQSFSSTDPSVATFDFGTADITSYRREFAEFGEISFDLTDRLQLTAGVRHSRFVIGQGETDTGYQFGNVVAPVLVAQQSATVTKFRAQYKITKDNLLYALASQGYRPGAPTSNFGAACTPELQALGYANPPTAYDPDKLWNYEAGTKNEFFDRRLTVNLDGYYIKWQHTQVVQNLQCGYQFISNAGGATVRGAEFETQVRPFRGLEISAGLAYTKATFDVTNTQIATLKGATLPNVPRWTVSSAGQYNWSVRSGLDAYVHIDLQHVDSRRSDLPLKVSNVYEAPYTIVNARIGLISGLWEVALFAKNLTDEVAILNTMNTSKLNYQTINQPRTLGIEAKRSF